MIIWSIQPKKVLDIILSGKEFKTDARRSKCLRMSPYNGATNWNIYFIEPYKWMVEQMKNQGIQKDNHYPVWGWYRYYYSKQNKLAPDLKRLSKEFPGEYRLKLKIPDKIVLLSDFISWHEPLNNMFCGSDKYILKMMTMEDNKTWTKEKFERVKRKSWQKVFELSDGPIQACFPSIKPEYLAKYDLIK